MRLAIRPRSAPGRRVPAGRAGFTLLEILIATVILTVVLGVTVSIMITSARSEEIGSITSSLEGQAMRTLEQISSELRQADLASVLITASVEGSSRLQFTRVIGYDATTQTAILELRPITYQVLADGVVQKTTEGETPLNDTLDNDNDGLIDLADPTETLRITRWVTPGGFTVAQIGATKQFTLSLTLSRVDSKQQTITQTYTTSATIRN